jgi:uncharacterized repeat protein (TIGR03803 family)
VSVRHLFVAALFLACSATASAQEDFVVLKAFQVVAPPAPWEGRPTGHLVKAPDGTLYGSGSSSEGVFAFKITPDGSYVRLDSGLPFGGSMLASDGYFYAARHAEIVRFGVNGPVEVLYRVSNSFIEGFYLSLVEGADGAFYGFNRSGASDRPSRIFRMTPAGAVSTLYTLPPALGDQITLISGRDGNLYGGSAGADGSGTLFRLSLGGTFTTLRTFASGAVHTPLLESHDGFYGVLGHGGSDPCGTIFRLSPDGAFQVLHQFPRNGRGDCPFANPLIEGRDGRFYGTTPAAIFSISRTGDYRLLHTSIGFSWLSVTGDYGVDFSAVTQGMDGNFYGVATMGGSGTLGVVFRLNAVRSPCLNRVDLIWQDTEEHGRLWMTGAIKTETPAFLSTVLVTQYGVFPTFVGPIPPITPALPYTLSVQFPPIGTIGILTILVTSGLDVCADWATAETSTTTAASAGDQRMRLAAAVSALLPPIRRQ